MGPSQLHTLTVQRSNISKGIPTKIRVKQECHLEIVWEKGMEVVPTSGPKHQHCCIRAQSAVVKCRVAVAPLHVMWHSVWSS
eukprot:6447382-Ditylum_brightwellii.AAC.1